MSTKTQSKARRLRDSERRAARGRLVRTNVAVGAGVAVILGLLVAIVVVAVNSSSGSPPSNAGAPVLTPKAATAEGAILVGRADAPVTLEVFLDYLCPYCGRFEAANSEEMQRRIDRGEVKLLLHPLAFLDRASAGTRYSTRTANAVVTVADRAPDKVLALNSALFAHQPAEGEGGLTDQQIAELATEAGVPTAVVADFTELTFEPWIAAATKKAFDGGITGTPTVRIDGRPFSGDLYTGGPLAAALDAARAGS
jgi:protein-disulfide isomerase